MSRVVWELAQELLAEGIDTAREEGRDSAKREIAATLLSMGADVSFIAKATGLGQAVILNLQGASAS